MSSLGKREIIKCLGKPTSTGSRQQELVRTQHRLCSLFSPRSQVFINHSVTCSSSQDKRGQTLLLLQKKNKGKESLAAFHAQITKPVFQNSAAARLHPCGGLAGSEPGSRRQVLKVPKGELLKSQSFQNWTKYKTSSRIRTRVHVNIHTGTYTLPMKQICLRVLKHLFSNCQSASYS